MGWALEFIDSFSASEPSGKIVPSEETTMTFRPIQQDTPPLGQNKVKQ